jgi:hypothetical protein
LVRGKFLGRHGPRSRDSSLTVRHAAAPNIPDGSLISAFSLKNQIYIKYIHTRINTTTNTVTKIQRETGKQYSSESERQITSKTTMSTHGSSTNVDVEPIAGLVDHEETMPAPLHFDPQRQRQP